MPFPGTADSHGEHRRWSEPAAKDLDLGFEEPDAGVPASGAMRETYVFAEVLKSWWNHGKQPQLYFCRDKEHREIDFLIVQDRTVHPVEVKKSGSPRLDWVGHFPLASRIGLKGGDGAIICLCRETLPLGSGVTAIPLGLL